MSSRISLRVQSKIEALGSTLVVSGQGNQGIQQEVDDIKKMYDAKVGDIKSNVREVIKNKKEKLSEEFENIKHDLQKEIESNSELQG